MQIFEKNFLYSLKSTKSLLIMSNPTEEQAAFNLHQIALLLTLLLKEVHNSKFYVQMKAGADEDDDIYIATLKQMLPIMAHAVPADKQNVFITEHPYLASLFPDAKSLKEAIEDIISEKS